MSLPMKVIWFVSSYGPLWLILTIQELPINKKMAPEESLSLSDFALPIFFFSVLVVSTVIVLIYLKGNKNKLFKIKVKSVEQDTSMSLDYLSAYILALVGLDFTSINSVLVAITIFILFAILYINHEQIKYNPTLELLGYRLYHIDYVQQGMIIDDSEIKQTSIVSIKKIGNILDKDIEVKKAGGKRGETLFIDLRSF